MARNKGKSFVRQRMERIDRVSRTWFELDSNGGEPSKTLVVEVTFDTDPNSPGFLQGVIDEIEGNGSRDLEERKLNERKLFEDSATVERYCALKSARSWKARNPCSAIASISEG